MLLQMFKKVDKGDASIQAGQLHPVVFDLSSLMDVKRVIAKAKQL